MSDAIGMTGSSSTMMFAPPLGAWVAYYEDLSAVLVFSTELDALRYSNGNGGMTVRYVKFGHRITDEDQS